MTDDQAIQTLRTIAQSRLTRELEVETETEGLAAVLQAALQAALQAHVPAEPTPATEADLARAALALLAEDPAYAEPIAALSRQPATRQAFPVDAAALTVTAAALLALQTRIKFKCEKTTGKPPKWTIEAEKQALTATALKPLIERLLYFLPKPT